VARPAYVHDAVLGLDSGEDPRRLGAVVTVELCGHSEHDGPHPSLPRGLDGRNARLTDGVERALGRAPRWLHRLRPCRMASPVVEGRTRDARQVRGAIRHITPLWVTKRVCEPLPRSWPLDLLSSS
jgi:hypothetical protein